MNRIFFSTNPYSLVAAVDSGFLLSCLRELGDKTLPEEPRYEDLLGRWGGEPVIGFDPEKGLFVPARPDSPLSLFLVNDGCDDPLDGFPVDREDYLIYHERTVTPEIKGRFAADRAKPSHHVKDPARSDYSLAFQILSDPSGDKVRRVTEAIFPSREQKRKAITLFISHLHHKDLPPLPEELRSLESRYRTFSKLSPAEKLSFVDDCLKISNEP